MSYTITRDMHEMSATRYEKITLPNGTVCKKTGSSTIAMGAPIVSCNINGITYTNITLNQDDENPYYKAIVEGGKRKNKKSKKVRSSRRRSSRRAIKSFF